MSKGNRGYRAAQLEGGITGGRLYLGGYAQRFGASGLTFFDDEVTEFFAPHAAGKKRHVPRRPGPSRTSPFLWILPDLPGRAWPCLSQGRRGLVLQYCLRRGRPSAGERRPVVPESWLYPVPRRFHGKRRPTELRAKKPPS